MKEIKKTKTVEYTAYQTSDGREWDNPISAQLHEDKLQGKRKDCPHCKGSGQINERYVEEFYLQPGEHFATGKHQVLKSDVCPTCNGKKYLELKWV